MMVSLALCALTFTSSKVANPIDPPVLKVFILAGQSNMVGHGFYAANTKRNGGLGSLEQVVNAQQSDKKFKRLLNKDGTWRTRDDVWIQFFERKGKLTVGYGAGPDCIGPELGFGQSVGDSIREKVLIIKIAWGGKSLAEDFRPPSSGATTGPYYTELVRLAKEAIENVGTTFPELSMHQVQLAGFGWHQGWNDRINENFVRQYQQNLANFIRDIRMDLSAPRLPFVIAETGMGGMEEKNQRALDLMRAQAKVAEQQEFIGNVAFVGTRAFWRPKENSPSDQGYHWNNNGETYFLIGEAMGRAMTALMKGAR